LARTGGVLAAGNAVAAMRTFDLTEMGEGRQRLRVTTTALALSAVVAGIGLMSAAATSFQWSFLPPLVGVAIGCCVLAWLRPLPLLALGHLERRRAFEPARVRDVVPTMRIPALLLAAVGLLPAAAAFAPAALGFVDNGRHGSAPIPNVILAVAGLAAGIVLAMVMFGSNLARARRLVLRLDDRSRAYGEGVWNAYGGFFGGPGYRVLDTVERRALVAGERELGSGFGWAGRLTSWRLGWTAWLLAVLAAAAVVLALVTPVLAR
jgi:NADH:ubiquinone oxidoreductase subunit 5 (subunit L)/multisubunit Na+/H+ antiporter MnhA subunit